MNYNDLNRQIKKGDIKNIYLFNVSEEHIARSMLEVLKKKIVDENFEELNFTVFEAKKINLSELNALIETMPMMSDKRLILIDSEYFYKNKNEGKLLAETLKDVPDYTTIVFFKKGSLDKRTALYKAIKKYGSVVDINKLNSYELDSWLRNKLKKSGVMLNSNAVGYFIEASGYLHRDSTTDLGYFISETEKLKMLPGVEDKLLTKDDIHRVISVNINDEIFKLVDSLMNKDLNTAFNLYANLKYNNVSYMNIHSLVVKHLREVFICKSYLANNKPQKKIEADYPSIHPYSIKLAIAASKKYDDKTLMKLIEKCADIEFKLKSGELSDEDAGVVLIESVGNR